MATPKTKDSVKSGSTAHSSSQTNPWRMSQVDCEAYTNARAAMADAGAKKTRAAAKDKPMSQAESAKFGKAMLLAIAKCDQELALSLLSAGAFPNIRDTSGRSALDHALELCSKGADMHTLCRELIELGAWVAPQRYTGHATEFGQTVAKGKPATGDLLECCVTLTTDALVTRSGQWSLIRDGFATIKPNTPDTHIFSELSARWRFGILRQALSEGAILDTACFEAALARLTWHHAWSPRPRFFGLPEGKEFIALLGDPQATAHLDGKPVKDLFNLAAWESDAPALLALMDAGLAAQPNWHGEIQVVEEGSSYYTHKIVALHGPLLAVAAASPYGRSAFDALLAYPPALDAARASTPSPKILALIPATRLFELHAAGVDIGSVDNVGTFAHHWARIDSKPRDGWAMLASKAPDIFEQKDAHGARASDKMANKLGNGPTKDEFLGSLSRIEFRDIRKEVAIPKPTKGAVPNRNRL